MPHISARKSPTFINCSQSGPNFQAFEIAAHFMSFVSGDLDKTGRDEFVPAKEFQLRWIGHYLSGFREIPPEDVSDSFSSPTVSQVCSRVNPSVGVNCFDVALEPLVLETRRWEV